jgi:hypothetical protein
MAPQLFLASATLASPAGDGILSAPSGADPAVQAALLRLAAASGLGFYRGPWVVETAGLGRTLESDPVTVSASATTLPGSLTTVGEVASRLDLAAATLGPGLVEEVVAVDDLAAVLERADDRRLLGPGVWLAPLLASPVPEPGSLLVFAMSAAAWAVLRARRRRESAR